MSPFADGPSKSRAVLSPALAYGLAVALLCWPAIWNGFPLVHDDVGGYLARWPAGSLEDGRSVAYGLLLWITRTDQWIPAVVLQSVVTVWSIDRAMKMFELRRSPWTVALGVALISLTSGAAFFVSRVMPDAWAAPAVLSLYLLAWQWDRLTGIERSLLAAIVIFAGASHMATLAVLAALSLVQAALWPFAARTRVGPAGILFAAGAAWFGLVALVAVDDAVAGRFAVTPGGQVFLFGRLVESGRIGQSLAEQCPRPDWQLCDFKNELPSTADYLLWGADSPLYRIGGWDDPRAKREISSIIAYSVRAHPLDHLTDAIVLAARQLVAVGLDELTMRNSSPRAAQVVDRYAPWMARAFNANRQQRGDFDVTRMSAWIVTPVSIAGLCGLPVVAVLLWRRGNYRGAMLPAILLLALVINAAVCGIFSGPIARYQARLAWLAPFGCILALASARRHGRREAGATPGQGPIALSAVHDRSLIS